MEKHVPRYREALTKGVKLIGAGMSSPRGSLLAYVGGFLGTQNLGDEALFAATQRLLPGYTLFHFDGSRVHRLIVGRTPFVRNGILAGGTLINQVETWLKITESFLDVCPRLSVFGTGVANPAFWRGRSPWVDRMDRWKPILEKCRYVGVRGPLSAALLGDAGIRNVEVVGDPVLAFAGTVPSPPAEPCTLGLNIGQSKGLVWGGEERILEEYVRLASLARDAKWSVKWFVVFPPDREITRKAAAASGTSSVIHEVYGDPSDYLAKVGPLSAFVGMKLHAVVLATCAFVPSVMIEYRPKCLDYMASIGQERYNFRSDRFRADTVWEIVKGWEADRRDVVADLNRCVRRLQEEQRVKATRLMGIIGTP